jgi:hypothetical protein
MKSLFSIIFTLLVISLLSSSGLLTTHFAFSMNPSGSLSLNLAGSVVNAGSQQYFIQQSGSIVSATVPSYSVNAGELNYTLEADVSGQSVTGNASFNLQGTLVGGVSINVSASDVRISGMVSAECLPNHDTPNATGSCEANDTSVAPAFFVGKATIQITTSSGTQTLSNISMLFESAYLNPFGASIVLSSTDSTIVIVTPYTQATVTWRNVIDSGTISGSFENTPISGSFTQVASEQENLFTGTANDSGTMTFSSVIDGSGNAVSALDIAVPYSGSSTIPMAGSYDCSASSGFPAESGVCTETGFQSTGRLDLAGRANTITGSYSSTWTIPAWGFSGNATAVVTAADPPSPPAPLVRGNVSWITPNYQGIQYMYPASVAINGQQFSVTFYESLFAQSQLVPGLPYSGYYSGTFEAISGCQPGANITISATVDGVTDSASGTCPAMGVDLSISLVFSTIS